MLEIVKAEHVGGYSLRLRFSTGETGVVDLKDALRGPVFEPLRDPAAFAHFQLSDVFRTVCWENGADLAPEFLHDKMIEQTRASGDVAPTR